MNTAKYIGDRAYDGTLERAIALILAHYFIGGTKLPDGRQQLIFNGKTEDFITSLASATKRYIDKPRP